MNLGRNRTTSSPAARHCWPAGSCAVAAVIAFATGDVVNTRGGSFRTHVDAVWVLGTLAVAMVVAAYALANEHNR